jgi:hypothetical protein
MGVLKDFDASSVRREKAVVGNDRHNLVRAGLNYMGVCRNPSCVANGKSVVHCRGAGTFIVNDDLMSQIAACPMCRSPFELETLVLHRCKAKATILRHVEESAEYTAAGADELLMIAAKKTAKTTAPVLPLLTDALLTMTVTVASSGPNGDNRCSVM